MQAYPELTEPDLDTVPPDLRGAPRGLLAERAITAHLDKVGYPGRWSAKRDTICVEGLVRGLPKAEIAAALKVSEWEVIARWQRLNQHPGDLEFQQRFVRIIRTRAVEFASRRKPSKVA